MLKLGIGSPVKTLPGIPVLSKAVDPQPLPQEEPGLSSAQLHPHSPAVLWVLAHQGSLEGPFLPVSLASLLGQSAQAILFHPKNNRIRVIPKDRS